MFSWQFNYLRTHTTHYILHLRTLTTSLELSGGSARKTEIVINVFYFAHTYIIYYTIFMSTFEIVFFFKSFATSNAVTSFCNITHGSYHMHTKSLSMKKLLICKKINNIFIIFQNLDCLVKENFIMIRTFTIT